MNILFVSRLTAFNFHVLIKFIYVMNIVNLDFPEHLYMDVDKEYFHLWRRYIHWTFLDSEIHHYVEGS